MGWEVWLASPVIIAIVGGVFALLQRPRLKRIEQAAAETKEQVTNDHSENLRDELTEVKTDVAALVIAFRSLDQSVRDHISTAARADTERDRRMNSFVERFNASEARWAPPRRRWWRR